MTLADLVQRYYDAFNRRDFAIYDRLFTPDCLVEAPGVQLRGIDGARAFDQGWLEKVPGGTIVNLAMATADRIVMCENRYVGRGFDECYMARFELEGERIKQQTLHFDSAKVPSRNLEIAQGVYAAYGRGDLQYVLDHLDDDVSWGIESIAAGEVAPHGIRRGKQGVASFFAAWADTADFHVFAPRDFVAAGDHVFNQLDYELTVKATGKRVKNTGCAQHWTFRDGKIIRWRGYEDTAATRDAFLR